MVALVVLASLLVVVGVLSILRAQSDFTPISSEGINRVDVEAGQRLMLWTGDFEEPPAIACHVTDSATGDAALIADAGLVRTTTLGHYLRAFGQFDAPGERIDVVCDRGFVALGPALDARWFVTTMSWMVGLPVLLLGIALVILLLELRRRGHTASRVHLPPGAIPSVPR